MYRSSPSDFSVSGGWGVGVRRTYVKFLRQSRKCTTLVVAGRLAIQESLRWGKEGESHDGAGRGTERKGSDLQGWGGGASQPAVLGVGLSRTLRPGTRGQGFLGLVHRRLRPSGGLGASGAIHTEPDGQPRSAGPQTQWSPCLLRTH